MFLLMVFIIATETWLRQHATLDILEQWLSTQIFLRAPGILLPLPMLKQGSIPDRRCENVLEKTWVPGTIKVSQMFQMQPHWIQVTTSWQVTYQLYT